MRELTFEGQGVSQSIRFLKRRGPVYLFLLTLVAIFLPNHPTFSRQKTIKLRVYEKKFYPAEQIPPLKYIGVKVKDKHYPFDEEIEIDEDFLDDFSIEVENQSDKNIRYATFYIALYGSGADDKFLAGFQMSHGTPVAGGAPITAPVTSPGESMSISTKNPLFASVVEATRSTTKGGESEIARIGIYAASVYFDNQTKWSFIGRTMPWEKEFVDGLRDK